MNVRTGITKPLVGTRPSRRAAHFWAPLNDWWRAYFAKEGRRPVSTEVLVWYNAHADAVWGDAKPSWKEARIHAKCLRSTEQVKQYFRGYRARKSGEGKYDGQTPCKDEAKAVKVEAEEDQQLLSNSHTSQRPPLPAATPSSSECAPEELATREFLDRVLPDPAAATAAVFATLNLSKSPMTITTGQQRSASECFPPGFQPQLQEFCRAQEEQPCWDRSQSSIVFHTPSLALRSSRKQLSPFILNASNRDGASGPTAALLAPVSSALPMAAKAQSFSCSSKRRHTNDGAHASSCSPHSIRHAASFSQGRSSFTQSHANNFKQQPEELTLQRETTCSFNIPGARSAELQSNARGFMWRQSEGGCELHASHWDKTPSVFSQRPVLGSMDRQLVDRLAWDAAAKSSMLEQASCGGDRPRQQEQRTSASRLACMSTFGDQVFGHGAQACTTTAPSLLPSTFDPHFADFWDLADEE